MGLFLLFIKLNQKATSTSDTRRVSTVLNLSRGNNLLNDIVIAFNNILVVDIFKLSNAKSQCFKRVLILYQIINVIVEDHFLHVWWLQVNQTSHTKSGFLSTLTEPWITWLIHDFILYKYPFLYTTWRYFKAAEQLMAFAGWLVIPLVFRWPFL